MLKDHPDLRLFTKEKIREKLLDIESDTYADLISFYLNNTHLGVNDQLPIIRGLRMFI